jgi:tetrahydrodipicolinate N-succinyltransferase
VLRGDQSCIEIGTFSNVQDRVVINTVPELKSGFTANVEIGDYCSVGHGSLLTSCVMEDYSTVGQGCIISEGLSYLVLVQLYTPSYPLFESNVSDAWKSYQRFWFI